jgi:Dyp-type peroxidase family
MEKLDVADIQGLLIRGYKDLPESSFLLCQAPGKLEMKEFLRFITPLVTKGDSRQPERAINLAITNQGIKLLDLKMKRDFAVEFLEGMVSEFRQRILGDYNANASKNWNWGNPTGPVIHFILMLYYAKEQSVNSTFQDIYNKLEKVGIKILHTLPSRKLSNDKEHFGFHDGISQPTLRGLTKRADNFHNTIADGEFIFGYPNEYGIQPVSPKLNSGNEFDLGKNGSYMVFRQIEQDVNGFWNYMMAKSNNDSQQAIHLASAMVGRYPSGTPLVLSPGKDSGKEELFNMNSFSYYRHDPHGEKCPIGSHIRKANPRDGMNDDTEESNMVAKRHRILRRGRPYGEPTTPSMQPEDIIKADKPGKDVGLYFICFNTNIGRQFEFIQQQWMNNKKFDHLYDDPDPIVGVDVRPPAHGKEKPDELGDFTIQACPVRRKLTDVPQFTYVKGGAYFFMPGLKALQKLSE